MRYTRPEMGKLWSEQNRFETWLLVELAVMRAQEKLNAAGAARVHRCHRWRLPWRGCAT